MKTRKKKASRQRTVAIVVVVIFVLIIVWGIVSLFNSPAAAKDFTLPVVNANGLTGQQITLSQYRGNVIVLEFMEPWCPNCKDQAPIMDSLKQQYSTRTDLVFLAVGGGYGAQPPEGTGQPPTVQDMRNYIQTYGTTMTYAYDSSATVFRLYGVDSWPRIFIISKDFVISTSFDGVTSQSALSSAINSVLT